MRPIDADSIYPWYVDTFKENKELGFKGIKPNEPRFSMHDIKANLDNIPTINYYTGTAEGPEIIKIEDITADELRAWMKRMEEGIQLYPDNSWTKVEDGLPDEFEEVLCYYEYYRYGDYNCMYRTYGVGYMSKLDDEIFWNGDVSGHKLRVIAWKRFGRYPEEIPNKEIGEDLDDQDN